ncbi:MAG: cytochrome bc complex cytochrome b subunit [Burkholderiales bacterium]|nr:cytochrome bc complex cytochrome b subunit [Burkholderiales bacterium]
MAGTPSNHPSMFKSPLMNWVNDRFPLTALIKTSASEYYAPKNFNFWYYFGSLALVVLVIQIATGIFLTMNYKPDAAYAFGSVEYIMRDVDYGWLIRYMHSTGASAFFIVVYLHMCRGLMYGSYRKPRELTWIFGMLIYLALMAEAFFGYLLPWGQMSFWGAQVIVNIFSAIPFIGPDLAVWIRGDYAIGDATLNRFFAFHVIALPLVLLGLVVAHLIALHETGSNNPDGVEINQGPKGNRWSKDAPADGIPFHPYYTVKDILGVVVFLMVFTAIVFFMPEMGGYFLEYNNFIPADPLKTPAHIAPVWYFTPYYSILRAVPPLFGSQFPGVIAMGLSVVIFFALPWLDRGAVKSIRYRGTLYKSFFAMFLVCFVVLGYLGVNSTDVWGQFGDWSNFLDTKDRATWVARLCTVGYFAFFFLMPWYTAKDKTKPEPARVTMH